MIARWSKSIVKTILLILVVIFAVLILSTVITFPSRIRIFSVNSGSMAPKIQTGDLIIIKGNDNYQVGDVVTFKPRGEESQVETITHRIVGYSDGNYTTKGDANNTEDLEKITPKQVIGRYVFRIPILGYVINFAKTPIGLILFVIIPGTIIIYNELLIFINEFNKRKRSIKVNKGEK